MARNIFIPYKCLCRAEAGPTKYVYHNSHIWLDENHHTIIEKRHSIRFFVTVDPIFLPNRQVALKANFKTTLTFALNPNLDLLVSDVEILLENVLLAKRQIMFFMHDVAPAHFALITQVNFLDDIVLNVRVL